MSSTDVLSVLLMVDQVAEATRIEHDVIGAAIAENAASAETSAPVSATRAAVAETASEMPMSKFYPNRRRPYSARTPRR